MLKQEINSFIGVAWDSRDEKSEIETQLSAVQNSGKQAYSRQIAIDISNSENKFSNKLPD